MSFLAPLAAGALASAGGAAVGGLLGGSGGAKAVVPPDLRGPRAQQLALLNYLLFGGSQGGQPGGGAVRGGVGGAGQRGAVFGPGGIGYTGGAAPGGLPSGGMSPGGGFGSGYGQPMGDAFNFGGSGADATNRLESFFGKLGVAPTALQRQTGDAIGQFLKMPAPEQRAMDISLPALQNILNGKPGQGVIDALQPSFDRNLASANAQGPRFGSANAILRSRAVDDFNLLGAQAAQQGQTQQMNAAQTLGLLAQAAGQNPFQRQMQGYGIGSAQANQADIETQRRLQILLQMLGTAQSATLGLPVQSQPSGAATGFAAGGDIFGQIAPYIDWTKLGGRNPTG